MDAKLYLRFGEVPASGRSVCHALTSGTWHGGAWADLDDAERASWEAEGYTEAHGEVLEPGVSVYGLDHDSFPDEEELAFVVGDSDPESYSDRTAYLVTGREIGRGFDGEPLLAAVAIVGRVEVLRRDRRNGLLVVRRIPTA